MSLTDQEEKDRYERKRAQRARKKPKEDRSFQSPGHHSRMYRYHDQMAGVLSRAIKKSGNKELKRQYDHHVARCKHHEMHLSTQAPSNRDDEAC